jgi:hypothetical protein
MRGGSQGDDDQHDDDSGEDREQHGRILYQLLAQRNLTFEKNRCRGRLITGWNRSLNYARRQFRRERHKFDGLSG